jgi:Rad3-related DNA helicase
VRGKIDLPEWVKEIRPHQAEAAEQIVNEFRAKNLVILDAPTGSGKTLIAEIVRQTLNSEKTSYVCSSKTLQDQFENDFKYSNVVKGRDNYQPVYKSRNNTTSDCQGQSCSLCPSKAECPYQRAKVIAEASRLACLNSSFQLYQSNYGTGFKSRDLIIFDEADTLESQLMGFVEVYIPSKAANFLGKKIPKPGTHLKTIKTWLSDWLEKALAHTRSLDEGKERRTWDGRCKSVNQLLKSWSPENWVRQPHHSALVLKPVSVSQYGHKILWNKGDKFLLMSATVISPGMMVDDLGWDDPYGYVQVPMTFPVENRIIRVDRNGIDMSHKMKETSWPKMAARIAECVMAHPTERVLVHTVSYELTRFLVNHLASLDRTVHHYLDPSTREQALADFRSQGGILLAPSMDRGVDFAHDDARVVIVPKIPFPNLSDRQISTRLHGPGGQEWYNVQAVRTLVQMTGRGVRSAEDWAATYILDSQFKRIYGQNRRLFPSWWREAVRFS